MHDANLRRIIASTSALNGVATDTREIGVQVRNDGDHTETIGVYADIVPPGGPSNPFGCQPSGRIIKTQVTLPAAGQPGNQTNVFADGYTGDPTPGDGMATFSCTDQAGAAGQTYTIIAAVDAHGDDLAACGPSSILTLACGNALADDDVDASDNRLSRNAFRVRLP